MVKGSRRRARRVAASVIVAVCAALSIGGAGAATASATTWLCRPGLASNPCAPGLGTTLISPTGAVRGTVGPARAKPKVDCFYVYPTVSDQKTPEASLRIDPEERSIALYQAARYATHCRIYAPMYRQITLQGLLKPETVTTAMRDRAYGDVRAAFRDYLKRYNKGRGIVFVSHSQGTFVLRRLIAKEVDAKPAVLRRLVSAVLLGGNVLVRTGGDRGGDFRHIKACRRKGQFRCVVAFSTFGSQPPANAIFGTPSGRNAVSGGGSTTGLSVLCTNPAQLAGNGTQLDTIFPSAPFAPGTTIGALTTAVGFTVPQAATPWVEVHDGYSGRCSSGKVKALVITPHNGAPVLHPLPDATWGLHLVDANIALGSLVKVVDLQATEYLRRA